jgi:hypothetical protein
MRVTNRGLQALHEAYCPEGTLVSVETIPYGASRKACAAICDTMQHLL